LNPFETRTARSAFTLPVDTAVTLGPGGTAERLFDTSGYVTRVAHLDRQHGGTADSSRFLMLKDVFDSGTPPPRFVVRSCSGSYPWSEPVNARADSLRLRQDLDSSRRPTGSLD
jgi:hypothetical protein